MNRIVLALLAAVLLGAPAAAAMGGPSYPLIIATRGAVLAIAAISLQFMLGFAGLVSFGHAAVVGIGAYAVLAAGDALPWSDLVLLVPIAMAAAALFSGLTGLVSLRTQGVTYIMITLAFGQMAYFVAQAWAQLGGDDGMALDARSTVFGTKLLENRFGLYAAVLLSLAAWGLVLWALAESRFGRALRAAAGNPARVASLGFDVLRLRLAASAVGGAGGGLAGVYLANASEFVSPAILDWRGSGHLLVMVILGTRLPLGPTPQARLVGAAAGAVFLVALEEAVSILIPHGALLVGTLLLLAALIGRR